MIVNLTEQHWILHRSYGTYRVRGCESGEAYALTRVDRRTAVMDLGDKRTHEVPIPADEIAADLCREINRGRRRGELLWRIRGRWRNAHER